MSEQSYFDVLRKRQKQSTVCVGLDPVIPKMEQILGTKATSLEPFLVNFFWPIILAVHEHVAVFKPNRAYWAALGEVGTKVLRQLIELTKEKTGVPVILDCKEGDIGKSNTEYAREALDYYGADAMTLNPYPGYEQGLDAFINAHPNKGFYPLCFMSNPGRKDLQNRELLVDDSDLRTFFADDDRAEFFKQSRYVTTGRYRMRMYEYVAALAASQWNEHGNCGLVVGATAKTEPERVRRVAPEMQLLVPGFGAQGGSAKDVVPIVASSDGGGFVGNSSSGICFAKEKEEYQDKNHVDAALAATIAFKEQMDQYRFDSDESPK